MNINAKQLTSLDITRFDITTALGFFMQIKEKFTPDATLTTAMGPVWTAFIAARQAFDDAYAQAKKWSQTAELEDLDKQRDQALSAFLNALKAMLASPNAAKQQAAKLLTFIREKYVLNAADEYMKETTAIQQMVQEMEASADAQAALTTTGLDDWLTDLKTKNEAFLAKMNERTEAQAGQQKGIVREKRLVCEAAYRDVVKLINAMAICEVPAGYNFTTIIDLVNAEIEHYRQILARKGGSSSGGGSNSGNGGGTTNNDGGTEQGETEQGGGTEQGGDTPGGDTPGGGGTGTITPDPGTGGGDTPGGDTPGGGDKPGGGSDPGDDDDAGDTN